MGISNIETSFEKQTPSKEGEDMAQRLAQEAWRNAHNPELETRFMLEVPGALGDEYATRWLSRLATSGSTSHNKAVIEN